MSVVNHAQAFFGRGSGGTYAGRPVELPPEDFSDLDLDSMVPVSAAQRKRRARFTWLVATIVVVLGLWSSVLFALHALSKDAPSKSAAPLVDDSPHAKSSSVAAAAPVMTVQDLSSEAHSPPAVAPAPAKSAEQKRLPSATAPVVALEELPVETESAPAVAPALAKSTKQKPRASKQKSRRNAKASKSTKQKLRASKQKSRKNANASVKRNWDKLPPAP